MGVQPVFKLRDERSVAAILLVAMAQLRGQFGKILRQQVDGATNHIGSPLKRAEVLGDPVRGDDGIGVRGEYGLVRRRSFFQALARGVHQELAGGAYVGSAAGKAAFENVKRDAWVCCLPLLGEASGVVRAVIQQQKDFEGDGG